MSKGLVIIPSFNEAESLARVCTAVRKENSSVDILVVDDGSTDSSVQILAERGIDWVSHRTNLGYVEALRTGAKIALEEERPLACFFDADGQHQAEDLSRMIKHFQMNNLDLLVASRFLVEEGKATSFLRGLGNQVFAKVLSFLTARRFTDISNGMKVLSPQALELFIELPLEDAHAELLLGAVRGELEVDEFPVTVLPRVSGKSMITPAKIFWYPLRTLLALSLATKDCFSSRAKG